MSRAATQTRDHPAGSPASATISVRDLGMTRTRPSGEEMPAFEHLTFDVEHGEFVCLIGPSGSGKTSTLAVIAGLERPTHGEVLVDGQPVTGPGPDRAVLFQEPALFPWLSVRGNMDLALRLADVPPDEREERAATWLARVEVDRSADRQPHELSAGMRQRAALARALACDPPILLGDEPFGALDALARERLQDIVQRERVERAGRTTFLFATHNVREAVLLADRVLVMSAAPGRLLEEFRIDAHRPRKLDDVLVARVVSEIHDLLIGQLEEELVVKRWASELGPPLLGIAVLLVVWAVVAATTDTSAIPSPADTWAALRDGIADGSIPEATVKSLIRLAFSFAAALVIGTGLGLLLAAFELARRSVRPLVVALQIIPFVAWVPLAVIWFGVTERAVVFVAIAGSFPSVTLATLQGIRQVPPLYVRAGRTLGASGWSLQREIVFPAALPAYMTGIQQAWGFAWKALMAGELIVPAVGASGLGHLLDSSQDVAAILAVVAVIAVIGVAVEYLIVGPIDRRVRAKRGLLSAA